MTPAPTAAVMREAALLAGVCAHPVIARVTDTECDDARVVLLACGSTREDKCPPCADRAKRLRIQQCREGWHLDTEPEHHQPDPDDDPDDGDQGDDEDSGGERRVRSTRRRQDAPDLPPPADGGPHDRPGVHRPERQDLPALDVPYPDPAQLRAGER
jgi:hypothetical protein